MSSIKRTIFAASAGFITAAILLLGVRFVTYNPEHVHFHANFAVYINGAREKFASPLYYQEIGGAGCTADIHTALERTHMHDNVSDLVHVHDHAVTWGNFFENLRWAVTDTVIKTPQGVYAADDGHFITFMVNGHEVQDISTELIHDRDRLLVDFGDTSNAILQKEFTSVSHSAAKYDTGTDPAACNANTKPTLKQRFTHLL